jgi:hypothetical protein
MLYRRIAVLFSTLSLAALLLSGPTYAQDTPVQIKLGVLNIVLLTQTSLMSKDIARQIDGRRIKFRAEIKGEEQALIQRRYAKAADHSVASRVRAGDQTLPAKRVGPAEKSSAAKPGIQPPPDIYHQGV